MSTSSEMEYYIINVAVNLPEAEPGFHYIYVGYQLSLNNQILDQVCAYKYLGLTLDEHLNFNKHVSELKHLISRKLYLLSKIRRYITVEASITISKTMILSVI